jgi:signal transduction histidine kinase
MSPDRHPIGRGAAPRLAGFGRRLADWRRGLPPVAVDAMLVIACYLTIVIDALLDDRLEWWVVALAALNTMPLLWRRRYPLLVTMIVGITTSWLDLAYQLIEIPAASLVATYTFAALSPPLRRLICVVGTVIGVTASITVPGDELLNLGPNAILFVVAYALGTSARARRARMEMLEERARRLAEEQDASAARERERIAREMHDILAHSMSLVVVQAEAGRRG